MPKRYLGSAFFRFLSGMREVLENDLRTLFVTNCINKVTPCSGAATPIPLIEYLSTWSIFMSDHATLSMDKAITAGLSEVTLARTLALFTAHLDTGSDRTLTFRGDLAEHHGYDKIKPTMTPARTNGNVVYIEAVSQKTGETGHYQILANQWKLLEVLSRLS